MGKACWSRASWQVRRSSCKLRGNQGETCMQCRLPRRDFIAGLGTLAAAAAASSIPIKALVAAEPLYPPVDLSYFYTPISPAPAEICLRYASITLGGNERQADEDIASLRLHRNQMRGHGIQEFGN